MRTLFLYNTDNRIPTIRQNGFRFWNDKGQLCPITWHSLEAMKLTVYVHRR